MVFREMVPSDVSGIADLAYRAFMEGYYTNTDEEGLRVGTYNYVVSEILNSTFAEVYEENGEILGFVMGYVVGKEKRFSRDDYHPVKGGSKTFAHVGKLIDECNERIKDSCKDDIDCEGLLFAMDARCRGKGIGTRLMDDMVENFKENGCRCMFLFTGDNCTMDYYDKRGYVMAGKEMLDLGFRVRDSRMYLRKIE